MKKFYFISSAVNLILIFLIFELVDLIINLIVLINDSMVISALGIVSDRRFPIFFYKFVFWWTTPFSILIFKKYRHHWSIFLSIIIMLAFIFIGYKEKSTDLYIFQISYFISIGIFSSVFIHFSQMFIGKKVLPTKYKN